MLSSELTPVGSMVLIREEEDEMVRPSGLLLIEGLNRYSRKGTVVSVGLGDRHKNTGTRIPNDVEVGDTVYFTAYSGNAELNGDDGDTLLLIANRDILAKEID